MVAHYKSSNKAVKEYIDQKVGDVSSTLELEADNSNNTDYGKVALKTEKLKVKGTENEIKTSVEKNGQAITIGLDQKVKDDIQAVTKPPIKIKLTFKMQKTKLTENEGKIREVEAKVTENTGRIKTVSDKATENAKAIKDQTIKYKANGSVIKP